jgi:hypothetical protein
MSVRGHILFLIGLLALATCSDRGDSIRPR